MDPTKSIKYQSSLIQNEIIKCAVGRVWGKNEWEVHRQPYALLAEKLLIVPAKNKCHLLLGLLIVTRSGRNFIMWWRYYWASNCNQANWGVKPLWTSFITAGKSFHSAGNMAGWLFGAALSSGEIPTIVSRVFPLYFICTQQQYLHEIIEKKFHQKKAVDLCQTGWLATNNALSAFFQLYLAVFSREGVVLILPPMLHLFWIKLAVFFYCNIYCYK